MPVIVVIGTQWGDEGKGKATDQLGQDVDYVVKFNGGNNTRHTVATDGGRFAFHLLPADVLTPGITPIIGSGVVVDLEVLFNETTEIISRGKDAPSPLISANAHITPPYNRVLDRTTKRFLNACQLGATGHGAGPAYVGKINRVDIRVQDLFDESVLHQKVHSALDQKDSLFLKILNRTTTDADVVAGELLSYAGRARPMVAGYSLVLNHALGQGKTVLFEAGQATMLDVDHGIYPLVTSSNPTAGGTCTDAGVGPIRVDSVIGVVKAYTTRVGEGLFPTELLDDMGERLYTEGDEYRVTTGRPRRYGWYDAVVVRYAVHVNGLADLVMTRLDVLTGHKTIPVCVAYGIDGAVIQEMPLAQSGFHHTVPVYEGLPGWSEDINGARSFANLPQAAQSCALRTEGLAHYHISAIGVGPSREATIPRHSLIG